MITYNRNICFYNRVRYNRVSLYLEKLTDCKLPCTVVTKSAIVSAKTALVIETVDIADDDVVLVADVAEVVRLRRLRQSKNDGNV